MGNSAIKGENIQISLIESLMVEGVAAEQIPLDLISTTFYSDVEEVPYKYFIGLLTVLYGGITGNKKTKPYKMLSKWTKKYGRKRVFELLQMMVLWGRKPDKPVGYIKEIIEEGFIESVDYPEIKNIYGS